jgi:hypothetical protein
MGEKAFCGIVPEVCLSSFDSLENKNINIALTNEIKNEVQA